jgi:hypothetical protein
MQHRGRRRADDPRSALFLRWCQALRSDNDTTSPLVATPVPGPALEACLSVFPVVEQTALTAALRGVSPGLLGHCLRPRA